MGRFIDLTMRLKEDMPVYPGDPQFSRVIRKADESQGRTSYQTWTLGNHNGTHIDYPRHVFEEGATSSDYDTPTNFAMPGTFHNLKGIMPVIYEKDIENIKGVKGALLLYTGFTELIQEIKCVNSLGYLPYLTLKATQTILHNNPHIMRLGIDSFSVDKKGSLDVHKLLLYKGIPIIEGLTNLSEINMMRRKNFTFHCIPLRVDGADAVPVRAYAEF